MPLPDAAIERVAQYFRALSIPMRLRIINALRGSPCTVSQLTEILGCSQANISKHLKVLAEAGIVVREAHGNCTLVSMTDPCIEQLCGLVCDTVKRDLAQQTTLHQRVLKARCSPCQIKPAKPDCFTAGRSRTSILEAQLLNTPLASITRVCSPTWTPSPLAAASANCCAPTGRTSSRQRHMVDWRLLGERLDLLTRADANNIVSLRAAS